MCADRGEGCLGEKRQQRLFCSPEMGLVYEKKDTVQQKCTALRIRKDSSEVNSRLHGT